MELKWKEFGVPRAKIKLNKANSRHFRHSWHFFNL